MNDDPTITVLYTCKLCGIVKRPVRVKARTDEDVRFWMERICMIAVGADHANESPSCMAQTCDVMIPMSGVDQIGGVSKS